MNTAPGGSARTATLALLGAVLDEGRILGGAEAPVPQMNGRDQAFARHLAYGVLRWFSALDWLSNRLLRHPLKRRDRDVHRVILVGLFELWQGDTAPHAAIHEAGEAVRLIGKSWAVGLVNAVLRRFQREQTDLLARLRETDECFAHPPWLLAQMRNDWPDDWRNIVESNNQPAPLWLRLNHAASGADAAGLLTAAGFSVQRHPLVPSALRVEPAAAVDDMPGFRQGLYSVQDPAAQLAAGLLDLRDGQHVLDACAAPGGKTCHILETAPGVALTALDKSGERLRRVRENLDRLDLGRARSPRLVVADAAAPDSWWDKVPFDRILLDAPCSATGVIRRHPEIKWLRDPQQVSDATTLQSTLLEQLWPLLKPGGILLYATCSFLCSENTAQIEHFAGCHATVELAEPEANWGRKLNVGRQVLPGQQDMDGFFYARLLKTR